MRNEKIISFYCQNFFNFLVACNLIRLILDEASRLANFLGMLCFMYNFCLHGDHFLASGPRKGGYDFIDISFNTLTLTLLLFLDVPRCVC